MQLHNKAILISPENKEIISAVNNLGITTEFSVNIDCLISYERYHADIQLLKIKDTLFIPQNAIESAQKLNIYSENLCVCNKIEGKYPGNVSLNAALIGDKLLCKVSALAGEVAQFCAENDIQLVNVKQGYTRCSTLVLNDKAIITADKTIFDVSGNLGIDALLIKQGSIKLCGADYGFIGGAGGVIGEWVLFFGDIDTHSDADSIKSFIRKHNMKYISLFEGNLVDIGGFVLLN